jgi:tetratricopeptide (TPR) repeat protein
VQLSAKYDFIFPESYSGVESRWFMLGFVTLAGLVIVALRKWRQGAWLILWTFLFLGPAANLMPFKGRPIGDQRLYLASVGFCLVVGAASAYLIERRSWRNLSRAAVTAVAATLTISAVLAISRAHVVDSWDLFWHDLIVKSPQQAENQARFAEAYFDRGFVAQATAQAVISLQQEDNATAYYVLGLCCGDQGDHEQAAKCFRMAIKLDPNLQSAYRGLGLAYYYSGQFDRAIPVLREAARLLPLDDIARLHLAISYFQSGRYADALAEDNIILSRVPPDPRYLPMAQELRRQIAEKYPQAAK